MELQPVVQKDGGFFCSGKFDGLERLECCYPFVQAITDYLSQLQMRRQQDLDAQEEKRHPDQTRLGIENPYNEIVKNLESIANTEFLLTDMIPALRTYQTVSVIAAFP